MAAWREHIPVGTWPALLREDLVCAYLDMHREHFKRLVSRGDLPGPVINGKSPRWSRAALDAAINPDGTLPRRDDASRLDQLLGIGP